ncbi:MAG: DegT/DnrJ/EryC1/StrS family aminotransferase [Hyphomicrobiales bacterium]|nr:DegT/DnrJ/EryC1/StrS family aminotransferase [Hyphomicrobiales bacterium]MCP5373638.1 DegT/DnrJ/EryC1/StrS family aminotransferase [Hyphomicrobiales bacterium]
MAGIPYVDMAAQFAAERERLMPVVESVLAGGMWVGGAAVEAFEAAVRAYTGAAHCVALNSGTDALALGLKVLGVGPGDEVITPPNSFVASTAAIVQAGAVPVFADVLPDQNLDPERVAAAVTARTRAIMPVHLTGRMADMGAIMDIAARHGLAVIEDAAQSIGSMLHGRQAGTVGHLGCFSAHPLKNLNAAGDAGFVVTDDGDMADRLRRLRNHGMVDRDTVAEWGVVSRMDTLQAAILTARLETLDDVIAARRANAARYRALLDPAAVFMPPDGNGEFNTYHTFVVQVDRRDALRAHLAERGIGSAIHYPVPIHLQPAAAALGHGPGSFPVAEAQAGRILSLPVHQFLAPADIETVAVAVNGFLA